MKTTVVNVKYHHFDVYVGRRMLNEVHRTGETDGKFGNPIPKSLGDLWLDVGLMPPSWLFPYVDYLFQRLRDDAQFRTEVQALKGKRLGCWCKTSNLAARPQPVCHGDVLAWVAERL